MAGYTPSLEQRKKMPEMQILGIHERRKMEMLPLSADRGTQSGEGTHAKGMRRKKRKKGG